MNTAMLLVRQQHTAEASIGNQKTVNSGWSHTARVYAAHAGGSVVRVGLRYNRAALKTPALTIKNTAP